VNPYLRIRPERSILALRRASPMGWTSARTDPWAVPYRGSRTPRRSTSALPSRYAAWAALAQFVRRYSADRCWRAVDSAISSRHAAPATEPASMYARRTSSWRLVGRDPAPALTLTSRWIGKHDRRSPSPVHEREDRPYTNVSQGGATPLAPTKPHPCVHSRPPALARGPYPIAYPEPAHHPRERGA
jgi:hypothetical protein